MYAVEVYATVRQLVFNEGKSRREVARLLGLSRDTVCKMCRFSAPPGYVRSKPVARPKLGPLIGVIDAILEHDRTAPPKQRHTAKRVFERLRDEHGFAGGYTTVRDYVREARTRQKETFVPLSHPPGHAQVDFGEALGVIGGERVKIHFFCMDLPHSILYDNTKLAVARILPDGTRERTQGFARLISHYVFKDRFGRPGKGNDKGKVEALVKHVRRTFLTPLPNAASFEALNAALERQCLARLSETAGRDPKPIGERLDADLAAFRPLPRALFEPCEVRPGRVSSTALVRYRGVDYSVPARYGHREIVVKGFVEAVVILAGSEEIARHRRSYERSGFVFDPLHYLALLEQKPGALDQAAPLQGWDLPPGFAEMRRLLEGRMGQRGKREFIQILRLMEVAPMATVATAVAEAIRRGVIGFDAVKQSSLSSLGSRGVRPVSIHGPILTCR